MTHLDQLKWFYYNHIKSIRTLLLLVGCVGIVNSILGMAVIPSYIKQLDSLVVPEKHKVVLASMVNPDQAKIDSQLASLLDSSHYLPDPAFHIKDQEKIAGLLKKYKLESDALSFSTVKQESTLLQGKGLNLKLRGNYENIRKFMLEVSNSLKNVAILDYSMARTNMGENGISASVNLILYYFSGLGF